MPPPKIKDELSDRLLMMLATGVPGWLKSSTSVPAAIVVRARVGVAAAEDQGSAARLKQAAGAADLAADRDRETLRSRRWPWRWN